MCSWATLHYALFYCMSKTMFRTRNEKTWPVNVLKTEVLSNNKYWWQTCLSRHIITSIFSPFECSCYCTKNILKLSVVQPSIKALLLSVLFVMDSMLCSFSCSHLFPFHSSLCCWYVWILAVVTLKMDHQRHFLSLFLMIYTPGDLNKITLKKYT